MFEFCSKRRFCSKAGGTLAAQRLLETYSLDSVVVKTTCPQISLSTWAG